MKIAIDSEKCQGHARCINSLAEVIETDELGYAYVIGEGRVPPGLEHNARQAVVNCPEHAIEVIE